MAKMYYDRQPDAAHDVHQLQVNLLGEPLRFLSDAGVFSKKAIDYGSQVLLSSLSAQAGERILDLGCGYGPIGITLAKHFKAQVTLVDVNQRALDLARQNADLNQVAVTIQESDRYEAVAGLFDQIVTNPPIRAGKHIVHDMIIGAPAHLNPGGSLTLVIQKKQGAPSAKQQMLAQFGNCETVKKDKGYYILRSIKED